jgi:beta-lactamase class A
MTISVLERADTAEPKVAKAGTKQSLIKRKRPGQRLLVYLGIAGAIAVWQVSSLKFGHNDKAESNAPVAPVVQAPPPIALTYPLDELRAKIEAVSNLKDLRAGVFALDPATGKYVDYRGKDEYAAASMIKIPVLVAMLQAVDAGQIKQDQLVTVRQDLVTGGSGWLQWRPVGSKIVLKDAAELMMVVSDNTATNMVIDLLGGKEKLDAEFVSWGLERTRINNMLGDFEGTNKTDPHDMVYLMARIERGELLSAASRKWMYDVMSRTRIRTLLNPGLPPGAKIAHKTGDIGMMVGDAGIVTTPEGKRYIVSVQVERPHNDRRANLLIRALSKMIYRCFSQPAVTCTNVAEEPLESLAAPVHHHHRRHHQ